MLISNEINEINKFGEPSLKINVIAKNYSSLSKLSNNGQFIITNSLCATSHYQLEINVDLIKTLISIKFFQKLIYQKFVVGSRSLDMSINYLHLNFQY